MGGCRALGHDTTGVGTGGVSVHQKVPTDPGSQLDRETERHECDERGADTGAILADAAAASGGCAHTSHVDFP